MSISDPFVTLYQGDALSVLRSMPNESVDMCLCSPPYWGLRTYKTEGQIWPPSVVDLFKAHGDGSNPKWLQKWTECEHEWQATAPRRSRKSSDIKNLESKEATVGGNLGIELPATDTCLKCGAWKGELGLEPTFQLYINHLMMIFSEVKRVMKKTGTCWVNIADSYAGSGCGTNDYQTEASRSLNHSDVMFTKKPPQQKSTVPAKSLIGIPERFALAMTDRLGFIRRNTVIWYKRNPMPESVKDRFTEDFEYLYMFSKQGKYYFEQQFEPSNFTECEYRQNLRKDKDYELGDPYKNNFPSKVFNELGRNKRCVWDIPTESGKSDHYAAYPEKLCETPILAGCPAAICTKCGKAREKVYESNLKNNQSKPTSNEKYSAGSEFASLNTTLRCESDVIDKGYSDCGCGASFEPGICLDPFAGTGTTGAVAKRLGRKAVLIELSPKYCQIIEKRISNIPIPMDLTGRNDV